MDNCSNDDNDHYRETLRFYDAVSWAIAIVSAVLIVAGATAAAVWLW